MKAIFDKNDVMKYLHNEEIQLHSDKILLMDVFGKPEVTILDLTIDDVRIVEVQNGEVIHIGRKFSFVGDPDTIPNLSFYTLTDGIFKYDEQKYRDAFNWELKQQTRTKMDNDPDVGDYGDQIARLECQFHQLASMFVRYYQYKEHNVSIPENIKANWDKFTKNMLNLYNSGNYKDRSDIQADTPEKLKNLMDKNITGNIKTAQYAKHYLDNKK